MKVFIRVRPIVGHEAGSKEVVTVEEDVFIFYNNLEQNY